MLFRLAYFSQNLIKRSESPLRSELRRIVLTAGKNNRAQGITGGLMFNRNYFGQVLEGSREAVSKLFCRIALDPRHQSVVIVEANVIKTRIFNQWAMGLAEQTETADRVNREFNLHNGFDPTDMSAKIFVSYILKMVSYEEKLIAVSVPI